MSDRCFYFGCWNEAGPAEMLAALEQHFPHVLANLTKAGVAFMQVHAEGAG